jgi:hypothetical protein
MRELFDNKKFRLGLSVNCRFDREQSDGRRCWQLVVERRIQGRHHSSICAWSSFFSWSPFDESVGAALEIQLIPIYLNSFPHDRKGKLGDAPGTAVSNAPSSFISAAVIPQGRTSHPAKTEAGANKVGRKCVLADMFQSNVFGIVSAFVLAGARLGPQPISSGIQPGCLPSRF